VTVAGLLREMAKLWLFAQNILSTNKFKANQNILSNLISWQIAMQF
jgi:hypothetical protein